MGDRYLDQFDSLHSHSRKRSSLPKACGLDVNTFAIKEARDIIERSAHRSVTPREKRKVMRVARKMMKASKKKFGVCYGYYVLLGAEYAEKVGEGGNLFVKKMLLRSYKRDPELFDPVRVRSFFLRNRDRAVGVRKFFHSLVPRISILPFTAFLYFILGIFFLSGSLTGFFVLGFERSYASLFGGLFFVLGIAGFFIALLKKTS